jgi:hypothetical protein
MLSRIFSLPDWARPQHPVLRYVLGNIPQPSRRARVGRIILMVLLGVLLVLGGYILATGYLQNPLGTHFTDSLLAVVFRPTIVIQVIVSVAALGLTAGAVSEEQRRQTWDSLRSTREGIQLTLRARWIAVFYRLRGLIGVILLVRLGLVLGILYDLTAFRGGYLDRIINGIVPDLPSFMGVILLSFWMSAALLLPIVAIGFDAALGLLVSTFAHGRGASLITQLLLALLRLAVVAFLLWAMQRFLAGDFAQAGVLPNDGIASWLLVAVYAAFGDWGLYFLEVGASGTVWATVPYAIFIGVALLAFCFVLALLTDAMIAWAVRRAERTG